MNPTGPGSMNKKIMEFDIDKAHPEIITRVSQLLDMTSLNEVQPISKGTATFLCLESVYQCDSNEYYRIFIIIEFKVAYPLPNIDIRASGKTAIMLHWASNLHIFVLIKCIICNLCCRYMYYIFVY